LYYPFWWKITSGGRTGEYEKPTAIVEMNAASGEVFIEDIGETILGSAGQALNLKIDHLNDDNIKTDQLKIVLVEEDAQCYSHLKNVIGRRWPQIEISDAEASPQLNCSNIYLLHNSLDQALEKIEEIQLGNAIFYFDPLRGVDWATIERVASERLKGAFQTGTEFIIFLFTSDWFLGRKDFAPLPLTMETNSWTPEEKASVLEADRLFGSQNWRSAILVDKSKEEREKILIDLYINKLHRWFRYILPMPFNPKKNQLFHLILCSNYEAGVNRTRSAYTSKTLNLPYKPDNRQAYGKFIVFHPETTKNLTGVRKPLEWKLLWKAIKNHEGGICDCYCRDFQDDSYPAGIQLALKWLQDRDYLQTIEIENAWQSPINRYRLNWEVIKRNLNVSCPSQLEPLSPEDFAETEMGRFYEVLRIWKNVIAKNPNLEEK
jgi:three-Cys-motif partner protein